MTYDLTIGERFSEVIDEEFLDGKEHVYEGAKHLKLPEAPAFPGAIVSAHTNSICIPWGGYSYFASAIAQFDHQLEEMLCTGSNDSENIPVTAELVAMIENVISKFKATYPEIEPAFSTNEAAALARLEILLWWSKYSLATFGDQAVIHIS